MRDIELKELIDKGYSKNLFFSLVVSIHGMWKQRQYTSIKELATGPLPKQMFELGYKQALKDDTQQKSLDKVKEQLEDGIQLVKSYRTLVKGMSTRLHRLDEETRCNMAYIQDRIDKYLKEVEHTDKDKE